MANAVERKTKSTKKKTNIFWSTVPENEQFRNVQVPGVDFEVSGNNKMNLKQQGQVETVRKSKSDPGVYLNPSSQVDLLELTSRKNEKTVVKVAGKRHELSRKNAGVSKEAILNTQAGSVIDVSGGSLRRGSSIKDLTTEDKKRVANLIKELATTGEERELALQRLQEERVSYEEKLCAMQDVEASLKFERGSLQEKLKEGQELLKKYETELEDMRCEKENLGKQAVALAQGTQTSPISYPGPRTRPQYEVETSPPQKTSSGTLAEIVASGTANDTKHPPEGYLPPKNPPLPVYSNSLFDLKMSKVEQPVKSSPTSGVQLLNGGGRYDQAGVHEFYIKEYKLQLLLQEQQLEVQRQQMLLQQHLQILQQQQLHPNLEKRPEKTDEPRFLQQAATSHVSKQTQFVEKENEVSYDHQGSLIQQQSERNKFQNFASNHGSHNDQLQQEPQNSWSHRSQVIDGVPQQWYHHHRDLEHGDGMQTVSSNSQKKSERNQHYSQSINHQYGHLIDHQYGHSIDHQYGHSIDHRVPFHDSADQHLAEQNVPAQSHHQSTKRQHPPVGATQIHTIDDHLSDSEQHDHLLGRKGTRENYNPTTGLHGHFNVEQQPPDGRAHQSRQSHCHPDKHAHLNTKQHQLNSNEYHRRQSEQDDFPTYQHFSSTNEHRSPTERLSHVEPNVREEYCHLAPTTCRTSELNYDQHHLKQSQYSRQSSTNSTDKHMVQSDNPTEPHSPQKGSGLRCTSDVTADNSNVRPNSRHQNNSTSHQLPVMPYPPKTSQAFPNAEQGDRQYVDAPVPLDQYISNYQNFTGHDPLPQPIHNMKGNKADIGPRCKEEQDTLYHHGYMLYKTDIPQAPEETPESPKNHRQSLVHTSYAQSPNQNYPNYLIQMVEDFEGDGNRTLLDNHLLTQEGVPNSDEEENAVLDNIFFLKR